MMTERTTPAIKIFQICYSEKTLAHVPAGMHALDNLANDRPDWREYWPIRNYLLTRALDDHTLYGFFSPRFCEKTGLDVTSIQQFVAQKYSAQSVVGFSPFWDLGAFFINVIEQGDFFHDGLRDATLQYVKATGRDDRIMESVMHSGNTLFCNYFLADKSFWMRWLEWGERLFALAESTRHSQSCVLNGETRYGESKVPRKVFVMERLVSMLLTASPDIQSLTYDTYRLPSSITPLNKYMDEAVQCDAFKQAWCLSQSEAALRSFVATRQKVFDGMGKFLASEAKTP